MVIVLLTWPMSRPNLPNLATFPRVAVRMFSLMREYHGQALGSVSATKKAQPASFTTSCYQMQPSQRKYRYAKVTQRYSGEYSASIT